MSPPRGPRVFRPNGRKCHRHNTELSKHLYCPSQARCDNGGCFIHQNIRMCHRKMSDCLALWLFFWHHFLFMRYSNRKRICWEEFVNSLVIRFHRFYQRAIKWQCWNVRHACLWFPPRNDETLNTRFIDLGSSLGFISNRFQTTFRLIPQGHEESLQVNDLQKANAACISDHLPLGFKTRIIKLRWWLLDHFGSLFWEKNPFSVLMLSQFSFV